MKITKLNQVNVLIKEERMKKGMSQRQLSRLSGVGNASISRIESGDYRNMQLETLMALFNALGLAMTVE